MHHTLPKKADDNKVLFDWYIKNIDNEAVMNLFKELKILDSSDKIDYTFDEYCI